MNATWQQGMGLMAPQGPQVPSLMNYQPGQWSQLAYQMAGSPNQGPYPSVPVPPGSGGNSVNGGGGGAFGGTALGILGSLARNPSLLKSGVNAIQGLLGGAPSASGAVPLTASQLSPVGTGAIDATANDALASTGSALADAPSGLMSGFPEAAPGIAADAGVAPAAGLLADPALSAVGTGAIDATAADALSSTGAALGGSGEAGLGALGATAGAGALAAAGIALPIWAMLTDPSAKQYQLTNFQNMVNTPYSGIQKQPDTSPNQALTKGWQAMQNWAQQQIASQKNTGAWLPGSPTPGAPHSGTYVKQI